MTERKRPEAKTPRPARATRELREARPAFKTEDDERAFWAQANTLDHSEEDPTFSRLEYTGPPRDRHKGKGVLLRLDASVIDRLKDVARSKGIGYQTLIRVWVMERLRREARSAGASR